MPKEYREIYSTNLELLTLLKRCLIKFIKPILEIRICNDDEYQCNELINSPL